MFNKTVKTEADTSSKLSNKDKLNAAKENNIKIKNRIKLKSEKIYIISTIVIVIILVIASFLTTYLRSMKYKPYIKYEEKMKTYGFDKMYDNKTAKTDELVTKSEALKIALASVFNTYDISGFAAEHNEYPNAIWVEYAKYTEITKEDININNYSDKVKYIDVISYLENCKLKFLKDQPIKDTEVNLKDISKYKTEEQAAIKDMVANKIIYVLSTNLNGKKNIFKGQLNEMVVNFVEKYNTITMSGDKINVNPEKIPSNADQYPYTITTVDKTIYEKEIIEDFPTESLTPKEMYTYKKDLYPQIQRYSEEFFNNILSIDYKTITEDNLREKLEPYLIAKPNENSIKAYVKHVIDNEIVIEGICKLQVPIIYSDGFSYRARLKLTFEIKSSKTKDNILYLDFSNGYKKTYTQTSYDILVDYFLTNGIGSNNMYMAETDLYNALLDKDKSGITRELDTETYFKEENK